MEEKNINDIIIVGHIAIFLCYRVPYYISCHRADNRVTNTKYDINIYMTI